MQVGTFHLLHVFITLEDFNARCWVMHGARLAQEILCVDSRLHHRCSLSSLHAHPLKVMQTQ